MDSLLSAQIRDGKRLWRTQELMEHGLTARHIRKFMEDKSLEQVRRGCFRILEKGERPPSEDTTRRRQLEAHQYGILLTSKGNLVYSHTSAACLWNLSLWKVEQRIHVTQAFAVSARGHGNDVHSHRHVLLPDQVTSIAGFRVTSLERTVVDCARILSHPQALIIADHALRQGANQQQIAHIVGSLAGHKGIGRARGIMAEASGLAESPGETLTRHFFATMNLPIPIEQYVVETRLGQHRLDFALPELMLAIEFDGRTKYFDYRPTDETVFQERRREKALTELGWLFIRIEWADLFRQAELKERVLTAIAAAKRHRQ